MKKKRIISCVKLLMVFVILTSMITGCALSPKIPLPTVMEDVYIYDEDNIIDDDVEKRLNEMLVELEEKTEVEFAVISVESLLDQSIETYANNLFNTLGIGKKGTDNGILLLISRSDTRVRLEIGRGLEGCLTDSKCGRILDDYFVPYRESDEYTKATEFTVNAVSNVLCEEYNINLSGLDAETFKVDEPEEMSSEELVSLVITIIIVLIIIEWVTGSIFGDGFGDGLVFAFLASCADSDFSGGSSGGGFGGGFSGGGGASR